MVTQTTTATGNTSPTTTTAVTARCPTLAATASTALASSAAGQDRPVRPPPALRATIPEAECSKLPPMCLECLGQSMNDLIKWFLQRILITLGLHHAKRRIFLLNFRRSTNPFQRPRSQLIIPTVLARESERKISFWTPQSEFVALEPQF